MNRHVTGDARQLSRQRLLASGLLVVLTGAFLSYTHLEFNPVKLFSYIMSIVGLSVIVLADPRFHRGPTIVAGVFTSGMALSTLVSGLLSSSGAEPLSLAQELFYPVVLCVGSIVLWRIQSGPTRGLDRFVLSMGLANFGVALLGTFGILDSVPFFGPIETGRWVFGTTLPSASGLAFNVNYFAVTQATLFFFYGIMTEDRSGTCRSVALWSLALSSLWGSSRGVLLSLVVAALVMLLIVALHDTTRRRAVARVWLLASVAGLGVGLLIVGDYLYDALRLYKGLNLRDQLWGHGLALWLERPFFGWGLDMKEGERFIGGALGGGASLHSGFLHTLVRGGLVLFLASYGFMVFAVVWGLERHPNRWVRNRWAVGAIAFYLVNATFRTYSLGGTGLLPVLAATGISICLHARIGQSPAGSRQALDVVGTPAQPGAAGP